MLVVVSSNAKLWCAADPRPRPFRPPSCSCSTSIHRNDAACSGPLVRPLPELSAEMAVRIQLDALKANDEPCEDHGLEVMYLFANAEGTFQNGGGLPCYFGSPSDLYHFGHFALKFKTRYSELLDLANYEITSCTSSGEAEARVQVVDGDGGKWVFNLSKVAMPNGKCWLTDSVLPGDGGGLKNASESITPRTMDNNVRR